MNLRKSLPVVVALAALAAPAILFAEEWHPSDGEIGYIEHPEHRKKSVKTGQNVLKEFEVFRRNPVGADGLYRYVDGEIGWERLN